MSIPAAIQHPAVLKAAEHHDNMTQQVDAAQAALNAARAKLPEAKRDDEAAYAKAIEAGKADPGEKRSAKAEEAVRDAERRLAAARAAQSNVADKLAATITEHHAAIAAALAAQLTQTDTACVKAIDTWKHTVDERTAILSALNWIEHGGTGRGRVGGWIPGLAIRSRNAGHAPATFDQVVAAMRGVIDPP